MRRGKMKKPSSAYGSDDAEAFDPDALRQVVAAIAGESAPRTYRALAELAR
jgi:hypothetical protein